MRRMALLIVVIAGISLLSIAAAEACGDKSLRIGRGIRFKRATRPAAVLIYIPSNSTRATQLQSVLKKAGHKSNAVQGADNLSDALKSGQYDLVFTDLSEARNVGKQIESSTSKPLVVPVVSNETKAEVSSAQKLYKYIVKDPHNADRYLDAIEEAMRSRVHVLVKKA